MVRIQYETTEVTLATLSRYIAYKMQNDNSENSKLFVFYFQNKNMPSVFGVTVVIYVIKIMNS